MRHVAALMTENVTHEPAFPRRSGRRGRYGRIVTGDVTTLRTLLVRVTGPDEPGISADLFGVLTSANAEVLDVEQFVVRRRLTLDVLVAVGPGEDLLKELLLFGYRHDLTVDIDEIDEEPPAPVARYVATILGRQLTPEEIGSATVAIASAGGNIDRIVRLSRYPVMSYEFTISGGDPAAIRTNLLEVAAAHPRMDAAVQPLDLTRRAKRLVILDVDSTLLQHEVIDALAEQAGCGAEVAAITAAAMAGELDFEDSVRQRVELLAGLDELGVERAWRSLELTPGARTFCRTLGRLGFTTALVSGGFTVFTERLQRRLGIAHGRANELEMVDGRLTGKLVGPVVDRAAKAEFLAQVADIEGVPLEQTVAIGDGANDLDMLALAGLGIAFNAKPVVQEAADTSIRVPYLDAVLFLLGVRREDIELDERTNGPHLVE